MYKGNASLLHARLYILYLCIKHTGTVQLTSKFTLKRERSHEPRRIFKSAHELLASARTSLAEL